MYPHVRINNASEMAIYLARDKAYKENFMKSRRVNFYLQTFVPLGWQINSDAIITVRNAWNESVSVPVRKDSGYSLLKKEQYVSPIEIEITKELGELLLANWPSDLAYGIHWNHGRSLEKLITLLSEKVPEFAGVYNETYDKVVAGYQRTQEDSDHRRLHNATRRLELAATELKELEDISQKTRFVHLDMTPILASITDHILTLQTAYDRAREEFAKANPDLFILPE